MQTWTQNHICSAPPDVFGTKGPEIFDITFDFEDNPAHVLPQKTWY